MGNWSDQRREILREIRAHPVIRWALVCWAIICVYDTGGSQLLPPEWAQQRPTVYQLIAMTTGWLSIQSWLLIASVILVIFAIEYPARYRRQLASEASLAKDQTPRRKPILLLGAIIFALISISLFVAWFRGGFGVETKTANPTAAAPSAPSSTSVPAVTPRAEPRSPPPPTRTDDLLPGDIAPINEALGRFHGIIKAQLIGAIEQFRRDLPDPMIPLFQAKDYPDTLQNLQRDFASLEQIDKAIDSIFADAKYAYYRDDLAKIVSPSGYNVQGQRSFRNDIRGLLESLETISKRQSKPDVDMNAVVLTLVAPAREDMQKYSVWAQTTVQAIEQKQRELRNRM